ncbi:MAG: hypothetical protein CM1200mP6_08030 [Anaerolineaceae bacterium]|nr:MAG: hypothetical protein CM1200mP6_08030 [Anaerolineaceae bacterium]
MFIGQAHVTTGCGDSHMAAVATELAFEQLAGISTEPLNAMTAARYNLAVNKSAFPGNPLLMCISASGGVARTREALGVGKEAGATTLALTANTESPLASISDLVLDCSVPEYDHAPGVIPLSRIDDSVILDSHSACGGSGKDDSRPGWCFTPTACFDRRCG